MMLIDGCSVLVDHISILEAAVLDVLVSGISITEMSVKFISLFKSLETYLAFMLNFNFFIFLMYDG